MGMLRAFQGRRMVVSPSPNVGEDGFHFISGEGIRNSDPFPYYPRATIFSIVDRSALDGIRFKNVVIRDGNFFADDPAYGMVSIKRVLVDGLTFIGTSAQHGRIVTAMNRPFQYSEFLYVTSYQNPSDMVRGPFDNTNRLVVGPRPAASGQVQLKPQVPLYFSTASRQTQAAEKTKKRPARR